MLDMYILKIIHVQILIPRDVMDFICQLGGCFNPSIIEQCWEYTFLNLYIHVKTK